MPTECVIGVDLGGTKLLAGAVDANNRVLYKTYRSVVGLDQEQLLDVITEVVGEFRLAIEGENTRVEAIGFGIPALMDRRVGRAAISVHLPLAGVSFGAIMSEKFGIPVSVDNDGNCAALAEARAGAGKGVHTLVFLGLGTGVSSGVVIERRLFRGPIGAAPELGHMVVDLDGLPCHGSCPSRGCLETVASGTALLREARAAATEDPESVLGRRLRDGVELTGPMITELALGGDSMAKSVFERIGRGLGVGLTNVVNIFNPDVVVIGGGVSAAGDLLLKPARDEMLKRALQPARDYVRVELAAFREDAGMIGAALLAREEAIG